MKTKINSTIIYQAKNGALALKGDVMNENIWATQAQIAKAFDVTIPTVNEHIKNIYKTKELTQKATIRKFRIVQKEGSRNIEREINHYNLDLIISVGYRINSKTATKFRQWATKTLRQHLVHGYTLNKKQIKQNYKAFLKAIEDIQSLLPTTINIDSSLVLDLVKEFSSTWIALDAYDKESLKMIGKSKRSVRLSATELLAAITQLKQTLINKGEASKLFAHEKRQGTIEGIIGNVMQSYNGKSLYPTNEEKAAHLLYFMIKNHPFTDGNKRSAAFAFIWFIRKAKINGASQVTPGALTALTLLIAESNPKKKEQMVALVTTLLTAKK